MLTKEQAIEILKGNKEKARGICPHRSSHICAECYESIVMLLQQATAEQPKPINLSVIPSGARECERGTRVTGYCTSILYSNGFVLRHVTGEDKWEKLPLIPKD